MHCEMEGERKRVGGGRGGEREGERKRVGGWGGERGGEGGREEESGGGEGERESETCVIRVSSNIFLEKISLKKKTLDIPISTLYLRSISVGTLQSI